MEYKQNYLLLEDNELNTIDCNVHIFLSFADVDIPKVLPMNEKIVQCKNTGS